MFSLLDKFWRKMSPNGNPPSPRYRQDCLIQNNGLYVIGGGTVDDRYSALFRYEFSSN